MFTKINPIDLTAELIQCKTVTPLDGGALTLLGSILKKEGFDCHLIDRGVVSNLFAIWGKEKNGKTLGFNGHTDVVPTGDQTLWTVDPFGGEIKDKKIWGRGACDMKSAVAAFVAAAIDFIRETPPIFTYLLNDARLGFAPVIGLFILGLLLLRWVRPEGDIADN